MCKRDEFLIWVELHHPDEVIDKVLLEEIIEKNPKMGFPKILRKVRVPVTIVQEEEKPMQDMDIIADPVGMFEEGIEALKDIPGLEDLKEYLATDDGKKHLEIGARTAAANMHATNCRVNGKAADKYAATLAQEAAIWSQRNPKTAAVIGVGTVALAGYGAYKLITEYVL